MLLYGVTRPRRVDKTFLIKPFCFSNGSKTTINNSAIMIVADALAPLDFQVSFYFLYLT